MAKFIKMKGSLNEGQIWSYWSEYEQPKATVPREKAVRLTMKLVKTAKSLV